MKGSRKKKQPQSAWRRTLRNIAVVVGVFLLYAYAVQVTEIDLRTPLDPTRQETLLNRLRRFGRPDLLALETETQSLNLSLRSPCPEELRGGQISGYGRSLFLAPNCTTTTQDVLTLSGEGFPPNARGIIRWHPPGEEAVARQVAAFRAGLDGRFSVNFTMPDVRVPEGDETQRIEVEEILGQDVTGLSNASQVTINRIIETILMALMASTIGTIIAVPVSFIAARNLMARSGATLAGLMTALAFLPIGGWLGRQLGLTLTTGAERLSTQPIVGTAGLLATAGLFWFVARLYVATQTADTESKKRSAASLWQPASLAALALLALAIFGQLGLPFGEWLRDILGWFGFFGGLIVTLADIARIMLPGILMFVGALIAVSLGSRYGEEINFKVTGTTARMITGLITAVGVGFTVYGVGLFLNWLYQFENLANWTTYPALIIGGAAGLLATLIEPRREMPAGLVIYYLMRGTLNTLRSIEPLVLGFVFVVWVGIGPFAGMLALMVHSIADLGKLFSEQVENIAEGPLEAVTATGANRVQTIAFAVIPQIIPPFIAFSFYRWDINVRMSTLIGFVGGGGIGLVLQQNINLLLYRQASVMIIAIAITVAILDYVSSELRNRLI
jgi:phosphonate ABC transporter permease subunit PhnE